jgi:hypothetical protein
MSQPENAAPAVAPQAQSKPESRPESHPASRPDSVIIRPWPKIVFLYPTMLCAAICWISQLVMGSPAPAEGAAAAVEIGSRTLGNTFTVVFFLNLLVFAFDFSRIKSITLIAIVADHLLLVTRLGLTRHQGTSAAASAWCSARSTSA